MAVRPDIVHIEKKSSAGSDIPGKKQYNVSLVTTAPVRINRSNAPKISSAG